MGVYTNTMRYTGTSGVDVESMVQSLMKAEGAKADKLYKQKTKLEWQQAAIRTMGTNVKTFRDKFLSFSSSSTVANMRSTKSYLNKSISGSFSGAAGSLSNGSNANVLKLGSNSTIAVSSDAAVGNYEVTIKDVASKQTTQGSSITNVAKGDASFNAKDIAADDYIDITVNGTKKRLVFDANDVSDIQGATDSTDKYREILQSKIDSTFGVVGPEKARKVTVGVDSGAITFTANKDIGSTFEISTSTSVNNPNVVSTTGSVMDSVTTGTSTKFEATGTDTYTIDGKTFDINFGTTGAVTNKDEYLKALNSALVDKGIKASASYNSDGSIAFRATDGDVPVSVEKVERVAKDKDDNAITSAFSLTTPGTLNGGSSVFGKMMGVGNTNKSSTFDLNQDMGLPADTVQTFEMNDGTKYEVKTTAGMTYKQFMDKVSTETKGEISLTFSSTSNSFKLASNAAGYNNGFKTSGDVLDGTRFGIDPATNTTEAKDAKVTITGPDGVPKEIVRESNLITFGGLTITLDAGLESQVAAAGADGLKTEITVGGDTSSAYNNIKQFIESYNTLLGELSTATQTTRAKSSEYGYFEPLTEEEKTGLSDKQIETLEGKAKQGILYNNPELKRLQEKMREITTSGVTLADGTKMTLSSIGITTGDYSTGGRLFITDEEKLRTALEKNADGVATLFTDSKNGLAEKLSASIEQAVGGEGYITKSAGATDSVYVENNYYSKLIKSKGEDLTKLNKYLREKENHYYKMFSYMETTISNANSQMASLGY